MSTTTKNLDDIAGNYHLSAEAKDKEHDERFQQYSFEWITRETLGAKNILEMGFGEGNFTKMLLDKGHEVDIIEGSKLLADQAKARYGDKVRVHHGLFDEFKPVQKFDRILATNILEHVDDPVAVLTSTRRWLKPDGRVLITVPNAESLHRRLAVLMGLQPRLDTLSPRDHVVGHQRVYDLDTLTADVHRAKFKILSTTGFVLKILPYSMMKDFSEPLLDAFHKISPQLDPRILTSLGMVLEATDDE